MCTISRNKFKRHYLKNKRLFVDFLLHFWNVMQFRTCNLEHFEKKDEYPRNLIISEIISNKYKPHAKEVVT